MPSIKMIITKGFATWLSFAVNVIFEGFSQIEVWRFPLQLAYVNYCDNQTQIV